MSGHTRRIIRLVAFIAAIAARAAPLAANPFMSGGEDVPVAPQIRTATSQGPLVDTQRGLREYSAEAIQAFADNPTSAALLTLLGAAALYGMLHAAGPGHRKTIIFSLFLGRKAARWEPLAAGFVSAGVHAGVGAALVGGLSLAYGAIAGLGDTESVSAYLDVITFMLLIALSAFLIVHKLFSMKRGGTGSGSSSRDSGMYGMIVITSLVPCPGATMLLLFSLYAGMPWLGIAAVLAMSVGMGFVISAAGYMAYVGREGLFRRLKAKEAIIGLVSDWLELISYLLVLAFSVYMAWPTIAGMIFPR